MPEADHVKGLMGQFTEAGVLARVRPLAERGRRRAREQRRDAVRRAARPTRPRTPRAPGPGFAGLIGWSWQTLLTNRPFDLWMHEQDIRRATGRPGNLDTAGAAHATGVCARSLGYVLGKRAHAPGGQHAWSWS